MKSGHAPSVYPDEMTRVVLTQWVDSEHAASALPSHALLASLLDCVYQASLLWEETAPVRRRVVVAAPEDFEAELAEDASELHVLRFQELTEFTPHALRKLAAAAGYFRALLAVQINPRGDIAIWGMVVTGTEWVNQIEGGRMHGTRSAANSVWWSNAGDSTSMFGRHHLGAEHPQST